MAVTNRKKKKDNENGFLVLADRGNIITAELSVERWLRFANHPREVAAEQRAKSDAWALYRKGSQALIEQLSQVAGAEFQNQYFRLNGHARALLWQHAALPVLPRPTIIRLTLFRPATLGEFNQLYSVYNPVNAGLTLSDTVRSAYREAGLSIKGKTLKAGHIADALHIALRGEPRCLLQDNTIPLDIYEAVKTFAHELDELDKLRLPSELSGNGIIAAGLISLALEPEAVEFWRRLAQKEGAFHNGRKDPIAAALYLIERFGNADMRNLTLRSHASVELCSRILRAVFAWVNHHEARSLPSRSYWFKGTVRAVDLTEVIGKLKRKKGLDSLPQL